MNIKVKDNKIFLHGRLFSGDDTYFEYYFAQLESRYSEIDLHLHTKGGDVFAGNYIISRLRLSDLKINLKIDGTAFSMGAYMLPAANYVEIVRNGFVMIHAPQGTVRGTSDDHKKSAQLLADMQANAVDDFVAMTGKPKKEVEKWFVGDNYFNAANALKLGLVNAIIDPVIDVKIDDTKALAEQDVYGRFSALLVEDNLTENQKLNNDKMKKELIEALGLGSVTAESSDTAVIEAVKAHVSSKVGSVQAKLDTVTTEKEQLETERRTESEAKITALLEPFKGKMDAKKIEAYENIGKNSGIAALEVALEGVKGRKSITDFVTGKGADSAVAEVKDGWNWDKYQKEDPRALEVLAEENAEAYNVLYKSKFGSEPGE